MESIQHRSSMEQTVVKSFFVAMVQLARDSKKLKADNNEKKLFIKFPTNSGHYVIEYDADVKFDPIAETKDFLPLTSNQWLRHEFVVGVDEPIETIDFNLPVSEMTQFVLQFPIEVIQKSLADFELLRTELINS